MGDENCQYWSLGPEILTPVYDSCSVVYRDELYVTGGRHNLDVSIQYIVILNPRLYREEVIFVTQTTVAR